MAALLSLLAAAAVSTASPGDCSALLGTAGDVVVDRATAIPAGSAFRPDDTRTPYKAQPVSAPFCRVEGRIEGTIGVELWLPMQWNGRLLGAGVGGDAGIFNYLDMSLRVGQGFATVTTDSGHKATDARWMRLPKARTDYEHRAVHLTAVAAKSLTARFYSRPVSRSYFTGCSGGGRQALKEMQVYPGDYDGVIAGAPGPNMPLQSVRMMWFALEAQRNAGAALNDADWSLYEQRVTAACDGLDGVTDGVITNPLKCNFKTAVLLCKPRQGQGCLSAPKLQMLNAVISPMRDERGVAMDRGLFPAVRTRPGPPSPLLRAMWADAVHDDSDWDALTFRRTADLAAVNRVMPQLRADSTGISPFIAAGHRAIIYQGWQDPSTNAGPTLDYYGALARDNGGISRLSEAVRLFMVPGMYHCRGGPGADSFGASGHQPGSEDGSTDMLWALIRWVEHGIAPERIVARKVAEKGSFTRPLCAFPKAARLKKQVRPETYLNDTYDETDWTCEEDPALLQWPAAKFAR
ncbi:tannase/feruloyl esterase family alpha/beta hydrolase [Novosphingobium sp. SL115]|uniref:tannase/feruloyl esterase family alpha/beta hydrolase n=1 Tax=Novosphingobium sp. SL115 TaxID=2995150 RepID=UPI002274F12D|nr:tannase/feruloyl esterase family alpha/beta hydrolase [Novosphingobium sp. SL115]MCY1673009.1 tannase/feruloyl esterase family alpha/beta hydrolase [Novosphingobium sp. SL115]